jgi:hypothetical protein
MAGFSASRRANGSVAATGATNGSCQVKDAEKFQV